MRIGFIEHTVQIFRDHRLAKEKILKDIEDQKIYGDALVCALSEAEKNSPYNKDRRRIHVIPPKKPWDDDNFHTTTISLDGVVNGELLQIGINFIDRGDGIIHVFDSVSGTSHTYKRDPAEFCKLKKELSEYIINYNPGDSFLKSNGDEYRGPYE